MLQNETSDFEASDIDLHMSMHEKLTPNRARTALCTDATTNGAGACDNAMLVRPLLTSRRHLDVMQILRRTSPTRASSATASRGTRARCRSWRRRPSSSRRRRSLPPNRFREGNFVKSWKFKNQKLKLIFEFPQNLSKTDLRSDAKNERQENAIRDPKT